MVGINFAFLLIRYLGREILHKFGQFFLTQLGVGHLEASLERPLQVLKHLRIIILGLR